MEVVLVVLAFIAWTGIVWTVARVKGYSEGRSDEFRWQWRQRIQEQSTWGTGAP